MNRTPKIAILLEARRSIDRQLLWGISQYSRLCGPWDFHVEYDRLDRLKPPPKLWNCSGMIVRVSSNRIEKAVDAAKVPVVVVDVSSNSSVGHSKNRCARIFGDSEAVAGLAVEHFSTRGFKQFAFVGAPDQNCCDLRCNGFELAIRRTGRLLTVFPSDCSLKQHWIQERNALVAWLEELPKPIGILACDDERAFQVLEACRSARISVPSEVAVMGVGNDELLCSLADPPLSSVAFSAVHGGYQAAQVLDQLMRKSAQLPYQLILTPTTVIVRASTDIDVSDDRDVSAARIAIYRNDTQNISIDALAKSIGVSRRTLELKFRKYVGRTILHEIQEMRLARAKQILKETELPIAEVASSIGYRSVSYFVRVFTKELGLTPAKYRRASRDSEVDRDDLPDSWKLAQ